MDPRDESFVEYVDATLRQLIYLRAVQTALIDTLVDVGALSITDRVKVYHDASMGTAQASFDTEDRYLRGLYREVHDQLKNLSFSLLEDARKEMGLE